MNQINQTSQSSESNSNYRQTADLINRPAKRIKKSSSKPATVIPPISHHPSSNLPPLPSSSVFKKRPFDLISAEQGDDESMDHNNSNDEDFPMIRCGWNDCGQGFWILEDLLDHLVGENGHVPPDPNAPRGQKCPCEWIGCPKYGKPQGSRMALMVHLRSHTGEKPFSCHRPECDKTFSRTDALAKHVRVSHGESLPPLRTPNNFKSNPSGSNKRIKAENDSEQEEELAAAEEISLEPIKKAEPDLLDIINPAGKLFDDAIDEDLRTGEERKEIQELSLKFPSIDQTYLEYVLMKAKIKFVLGERELLKAELQILETKEESVRRQKDSFLDEIMKRQLGLESAPLWRSTIDQVDQTQPIPTNMTRLVKVESPLPNQISN
ncbi:hypothetical protein O181_037730 [Austropuccinia psidii MF-1]|uniref:C2H2-type domain-containing protein n=1 Tax=Austropuccinia psidii MF-1 TaxID=1389203 RepID=A0A9Q3D8P7_9BASI|nr:hypothetical protein [Austropuccinia psidii MF-1]